MICFDKSAAARLAFTNVAGRSCLVVESKNEEESEKGRERKMAAERTESPLSNGTRDSYCRHWFVAG